MIKHRRADRTVAVRVFSGATINSSISNVDVAHRTLNSQPSAPLRHEDFSTWVCAFLVLISQSLITLGSASGFIGFPAAQALVRAGHQVIGLTRSQEKAKQLAAEESRYCSPVIMVDSSYQLLRSSSYPHPWSSRKPRWMGQHRQRSGCRD